jgi:uncharacterized protein
MMWILLIVGIFAELIDGTLGMGFGLVSSTLLLSFGYSFALASAMVHLAEMVTAFFSGMSHLSFGHIDKRIFFTLTASGIVGGLLGVLVAVNHGETRWIKLLVGILLLAMGLLIIVAFRSGKIFTNRITKKAGLYIGFPAAFIDALIGGGWGPIATPSLILHGSEAKHAIGTVNLSEFFVTLAISAGFLLMLPFDWKQAIPLIIGAIIISPFSAYLTKKIKHRKLGLLVGFMIVILSIRNIFMAFR